MKKISLFSFLAAALLCVGQNAMAAYTPTQETDTIMLTKTNITACNYLTVSADKWVTSKNYGDSFGVTSADYFNMSSTDRTITVQLSGVESFEVYVFSSNANRNYTIQVGTATAQSITHGGSKLEGSGSIATNTTDEISIKIAGAGESVYPVAIVVKKAATKDDATLKAIKVDGTDLEGFDAATTEYNVELPYGTTTAPVVSATATSDKANVAITQATSATGTATILVTAEDGTTTKTYTINFSVSASVSTDATLKSLSIDGNAVAGFRADSLNYKYEIAYTAAIPVISAEVNDIAATMEITQVTETPGTATVVVTAQDGTTKITYTIDISRAAAIKHLTVVPFSNSAKGAIDESALTVTVPYLAGTDEPTVDVAGITTSGDGASAALSEDGKTITLTGADGVSTEYTIVLQPLAANSELGTDLIIFDGTETYIFGVYGFEAEGTDSKGKPTYKGWKFAKNQDDEGNMRNASGKTRIYMALPPAKSVDLTSGTGGVRGVEIYVNGEKSTITKTAENGKAITLALDESQNNFIAIESKGNNGDGGFIKMQLAKTPEGPETSFEQAEVSVKAVKVVRDGQLYILRDGKTYTAQGIVVE